MYFEGFLGLISFIALIALIVIVARQNSRLGLLERELGALRSFVLSLPMPGEGATATPAKRPTEAVQPAAESETAILPWGAPAPAEPLLDAAPTPESAVSLAATEAAAMTLEPAATPSPATAAPFEFPANTPPKRPDIETALGTRWAVWVGGVALALGGIFLIRYTIEAGFFGPAARLTLAAIFGLVLMGAGEYIRRTGYRMPAEGAAGAYIPAVLTAAGAFTLFGTVYAAHGVYGFLGPGTAFVLLGIIGVGTIALALIHGQALAGVGLLGSLVTPVLVSSQAPNAWALFGYLAIVLAATAAIARIRTWRFLVSAAFAGMGLWSLVYLSEMQPIDLTIVAFVNLVTLAVLAVIWLGWQPGDAEADAPRAMPAAMPAFFVGLSAAALLIDPEIGSGDAWLGAVLIVAMVGTAVWRMQALPLLYGAAAAASIAYLRYAFAGSFDFEIMGEYQHIEGFPAASLPRSLGYIGLLFGAAFVAAGFWQGRAFAVVRPALSASWTACASIVPLVILFSLWVAAGNLDRDIPMALAALVLALALAAVGEWVARSEEPPLAGGTAVSFALGGAAAAAVLMLHMGFGPALTTILMGLAVVLPALATRLRAYPVLGWLCVVGVIVVLLRVAVDPTIVGPEELSATPVFNVLLPGYGIPALAFAFAAWQLARTTAGRPRLVMEAAASLFSLLALAMLVRHAMNGGVIYAGAPSLAEQAIYSLIGLGAGAILIAIDMRSPSSVMRIGSLAIGVASVALIVLQHFLALNPLFTEESTGRIPFFNLLFLAYLLPALAAGAVALYARNKRPQWYSIMLGLLAAALAFTYATLSVRRLFQGEFIGLWRGFGQLETYSYSALWLVMGVGLLVLGVFLKSNVLRLASGALIAVAVAKVFLFDMSELEGFLRALSFIGLGAVLIGIGLFYQRLLTRAAGADQARKG